MDHSLGQCAELWPLALNGQTSILAEVRGSVLWGCANSTTLSLVMSVVTNVADPASCSTAAPLSELNPALAVAAVTGMFVDIANVTYALHMSLDGIEELLMAVSGCSI